MQLIQTTEHFLYKGMHYAFNIRKLYFLSDIQIFRVIYDVHMLTMALVFCTYRYMVTFNKEEGE